MSRILAIDPGSTQSAYLVYDTDAPLVFPQVFPGFGIKQNEELRRDLAGIIIPQFVASAKIMVLEQVEHYGTGMPVGKTIFDTCIWMGRFIESWGGPYRLMPRREVKLHLCQSARGNDATVRAALMDRFGTDPIGTKRRPGVLHGISKDIWSALALAVTYADHAEGRCGTCGWEEKGGMLS